MMKIPFSLSSSISTKFVQHKTWKTRVDDKSDQRLCAGHIKEFPKSNCQACRERSEASTLHPTSPTPLKLRMRTLGSRSLILGRKAPKGFDKTLIVCVLECTLGLTGLLSSFHHLTPLTPQNCILLGLLEHSSRLFFFPAPCHTSTPHRKTNIPSMARLVTSPPEV